MPHRTVNDFSKVLITSENKFLEKELVNYNLRTGNAIVFVSLDSLTDPRTKDQYTIEEAALLYFNKWGIGDKVKNNGVLLMMSRSPRRVRIQVGTGLGVVLTDSYCKEIIDNNLVPNFKQGLFFTGIKEAVEAIENRLDNPTPAVQQNAYAPYQSQTITTDSSNDYKGDPKVGFAVIAFIIVFCFGIFKLASAQARRQGGWFNSGGYYRQPSYRNSFNNYSNNNFFSGGGGGSRSSGGGGSSSSSSSSSSSGGGSYGGGSSSGGGASGSW